jgi:uncharacterized repeat protein (TIGR03803 family)
MDSAGNLYGTTTTGGGKDGGCIYEISATGQFSELYSFNSTLGPAIPKGGLVRDSAGNFYGTTEGYNDFRTLGAVYKVEPGGQLDVLYKFPGAGDGTSKGSVNAGMILDSEGNLYGTTPYGGMEGMVY